MRALLVLLLAGCSPLDSWNPVTAASRVPAANGCPQDKPNLHGPDNTGKLYCEPDWYDPDDPGHMMRVPP